MTGSEQTQRELQWEPSISERSVSNKDFDNAGGMSIACWFSQLSPVCLP